MPATVEFPIRVCTDAKALLLGQDDLLGATERALGRALRNARRSVPGGARDSALPAVCNSVRWIGADVGAVDEPTRAAIEQRLAELIDELVHACAEEEALTPLAARSAPGEPVDSARLDPLLGLYTLPSYRDGNDTTVAVAGQAASDPDPGPPLATLEWLPIGSLEQLQTAVGFELAARDRVFPEWGDLGAIYRTTAGSINVMVQRMPGDHVLIDDLPVLGLRAPRLNDARTAIVSRPVELPVAATYRLRYLAPASADGRAAFVRQYHQTGLTRLLREHARRPHTMSDADFDAQVTDRVHTAIEAIVASFPPDIVCFLELRVNAATYLLYSGIDVPADLNVELLPIAQLGAPHPRPRARRAPPPDSDARAGGSAVPGDGGSGAGSGAGTGEQGSGLRGGTGSGTGAGSGSDGAGDQDGADTGAGGSGAGEDPGGSGARQRGFVDLPPLPGAPPRDPGSAFPTLAGAQLTVDVCEPFLGEPSADALGADGAALRRAMGRVAEQLEILPCEYVGHFLISAATTLGQRAQAVGMWDVAEAGELNAAVSAAGAATTAPPGTLGSVEFHPHASVQVQLLRHLASVVPLITGLSGMLQRTIAERGELISDEKHNEPVSWTLRFIEELHPILDESVAELFKMTCRVLFVQLLLASGEAIDERRREPGLSRFVALFEQAVLPQLADVDELLALRTRLQNAVGADATNHANQQIVDAMFANVPRAPGAGSGDGSGARPNGTVAQPASWREASANLTGALSPHGHLTGGTAAANAYETIQANGAWRIRDRNGQLWTLEAIERSIVLRRGTIESVEPLVKQLTDLPDVMERFRSPEGGVRAELVRLLDQMSANNVDITQRAIADPDYGFKASRIVESEQQTTVPGALYALVGIHLYAHREIGEFFAGDPFYARGLDYLFSSELGRESLVHFGELVGLVALSIICPPAGIAAGVGLAVDQYADASERERVYGALIDPEQVLSYAEVEAGLFAAELGLVLSLIPVAGKFVGEARAVFAVAEEEAAAVSEAAARAAAQEAAAAMLRTAEQGFVEQFVVELAKAYVIQRVFEAALAPIMASLQREWGITGPIGGLERGLAELASRTRARGALPPAAAGSGR
jgi:hypothetical protein